MTPLAWILLVPLLQPISADDSSSFVQRTFSPSRWVQLEPFSTSIDAMGGGIPGRYFRPPAVEQSRNHLQISRWSYSLGRQIYRGLLDRAAGIEGDDFGECLQFGDLSRAEAMIDGMPADYAFHPLGTDPLLHAPPWWLESPKRNSLNSPRLDRTPTVSILMCDPQFEAGKWIFEKPQLGIGLTLDLGPENPASPWGCRLTANFDDHGEMGVLLQFCWH